MKKTPLLALLSILLVLSSQEGRTEIKLPSVIGSGMVLQRDMQVPIWGWAEAGEEITVSFAGQTKTTTTNAEGKWMVKLDPLKASGNASKLKIKGSNTIDLENILVGEVWIC